MCGIAGALSTRYPVEQLLAPVGHMTQAQVHRGPDDSGLCTASACSPAVVLGHRRLSIVDLSSAGHQPMHDPEADTWIVFNGELYNFRELRGELVALGHRFRSQTDTEVLLKAYAQWGNRFLARLRGMFAFGLWDVQNRTLLLARDQLGIKPLYWWFDGASLLFASEVRGLLASGLVARSLCPEGLLSYCAFGSVQDPWTLVRGVQSLYPGEAMAISPDGIERWRYWQLPVGSGGRSFKDGELYQAVEERLRDAVRGQLIADVPLGAFLSGGIDSAAVVALMSAVAPERVQTFTVGFEEQEYDERTYARLTATYAGTKHTELTLTGEDVLQAFPSAVQAFDQPSVDGLNTYFVSRAVRQAGLSVALSGLGGDELFGGYNAYRRALQAERAGTIRDHIPGFLRSTLASVVGKASGWEPARRTADLLRSSEPAYFFSRRFLGTTQILNLVDSDVVAEGAGWRPKYFDELVTSTEHLDPINRASALEMRTYMLSTLLRDTDQMSMAHGLEVRVPLIDVDLVDLVLPIPGNSKVNQEGSKPLLTRSLGTLLPPDCNRRRKRGFELPFAVWFRGSLKARIRELFEGASSGNGRSPLQPRALELMWYQFLGGEVSWSRIWGIYILSDWLRRHRMTA